MKKYLFLLSLLVANVMVLGQTKPDRTSKKEKTTPSSYRAGAFIDVNQPQYPETDYDIEQLVSEVLISGGASGCSTAGVSNVKVSPALPENATAEQIAQYKQKRSWGYFNKANTDFPFEAGIVLVTGEAHEAGNELDPLTLSSINGAGTDADLVAATGTTSVLNDATYIEFDFIPTSTQVKFRYIFASEEYDGSFSCTYDDAFALLLRKQGETNYVNLAVLPNGAGPVAVTNIHGNTPTCGPVNEQYFAGQNDANIETNFNGRTVPLTAVADVIPGQIYHFKMVIADARDKSFNSAVFLEAGSFDVGLKIVDENDVALPPEVIICENYSITLKSSVEIDGATYQWFFNGTAISDATTATFVATEAGTYSLEITVPGSQCPATASIDIINIPQPSNKLPEVSGVICEGDFIVLDAGAPLPGQEFTYEWSNGETTQMINVGEAGMYTVNINNGVCIETYSTVVEKAEIPVIKNIQYKNDVVTVTAENLGAGELEYSADGGVTWQDSNEFTNVESNIDIIVSVRVKTTSCLASLDFYTFKMQNVITPNEDGRNDYIDFNKISRYNKFDATIFDRYGRVVYQYTESNRVWDGEFQGKKIPTDSYWYKLSYENPASKELEVETGWILLKNRVSE